MAFVIARLITIPFLMIGSAWLIARYRVIGVAVSVLLGWVILFAVYNLWPAPPGVWDEDREEIHISAPIVMSMWCFPVWGIVGLWSWLKLRRDRNERA
jgi:hypothetical protein